KRGACPSPKSTGLSPSVPDRKMWLFCPRCITTSTTVCQAMSFLSGDNVGRTPLMRRPFCLFATSVVSMTPPQLHNCTRILRMPLSVKSRFSAVAAEDEKLLIGTDNEPLQVLFPKLCGESFSGLKTGLMADTDAVKWLIGSKGLDRNACVFRFQSSFQVLGCALTFKRANLNCKGRSRRGRRSWGFEGLLP